VGGFGPHGGGEDDAVVVCGAAEALEDVEVFDGGAGEADVGDAVEEDDAEEGLVRAVEGGEAGGDGGEDVGVGAGGVVDWWGVLAVGFHGRGVYGCLGLTYSRECR